MPLAGAGGDWSGVVDGAARTLEGLPRSRVPGSAVGTDLQEVVYEPGLLISTTLPTTTTLDIPTYGLLRVASASHSETPIPRTAVYDARPKGGRTRGEPRFRHGGPLGAKSFFEQGPEVFTNARLGASTEFSNNRVLRLQTERGQSRMAMRQAAGRPCLSVRVVARRPGRCELRAPRRTPGGRVRRLSASWYLHCVHVRGMLASSTGVDTSTPCATSCRAGCVSCRRVP